MNNLVISTAQICGFAPVIIMLSFVLVFMLAYGKQTVRQLHRLNHKYKLVTWDNTDIFLNDNDDDY